MCYNSSTYRTDSNDGADLGTYWALLSRRRQAKEGYPVAGPARCAEAPAHHSRASGPGYAGSRVASQLPLNGNKAPVWTRLRHVRNAARAVDPVRDKDWPPRAVTMRVLDADGREVHSAVRGNVKGLRSGLAT